MKPTIFGSGKLSIPFFGAFALASLAALTGCLGGDEPSATVNYETRILDIDRDLQTITSLEEYWYCEGEDAVHDTDIYEERYQIAGGKLYRWEEDYGCMAAILSGSSNDIVGTWTGAPPTYGSSPAGDSAYCDELAYADRTHLNAVFRNARIVEKISETRIKGTATGEVCWAELQGWLLTTNSGMDDEIAVTENNCSSVTLTRESDDVTARIEIQKVGGGLKAKFTTEGAACSATLPATDEDKPVCTDGGAEAAFEDCVYASGYFGDDVFYKPGAAAANKRHALRILRGVP